MNCRHCDTKLDLSFLDLGNAPPSNSYLTSDDLDLPEKTYPLKILVCTECWLVQTEDFADATELFSADYAYFSSFSTTWLAHAEKYVSDMTERFHLDESHHVVEVAANDGYLLQYVKKLGIPCLGIEPTFGTANAAREIGIDIVEEFFGSELAKRLVAQGKRADLTVANNVLAHVPDINDFVSGYTVLLNPSGVATFEFPHLLRLVSENQFDTIYHEHFSYLSLTSVNRIFERNGLKVFDVEELSTHGGSLRVFAQRSDSNPFDITDQVSELLSREEASGMVSTHYYSGFQTKALQVINGLTDFLITAQNDQKSIAAYGAAAKGNTLLNFAEINRDSIPYVVDLNPAKQGKYLPGSRIPIVDESRIREDKPDYVIVLPWNLRTEIMNQLAYIREWGGKFVTAVPTLEID